MKNLIAWVEIPAKNIEESVAFYNNVLKINMEVLDFGREKMACFPNDEGAISNAPNFEPSDKGVLVSFNVADDIDSTLERVRNEGGAVVTAKTKIEAEHRGYFAVFSDTEGNSVGLYGDK